MSGPRDSTRTWALVSACEALALALFSQAGPRVAIAALAAASLAAWAGAALALSLSGRRALLGAPAAAAVLLHGAPGALVVWAAGALVIAVRRRGEGAPPSAAFVTRTRHMRRVMDMPTPADDAYRALLDGFAGPPEELRAAIAPVASLPPSVAIPVLSRLSLHTDSITRLTARKRLELMLLALREEGESPTPERDARHAALRIRKAESLLTLADLGASDPDERRRLLTAAAALATVAAADFPGNPHYAATAACAAARVGELDAARKLLTRVSDPRRAWSARRVVRLCERMMPARRTPALAEPPAQGDARA